MYERVLGRALCQFPQEKAARPRTLYVCFVRIREWYSLVFIKLVIVPTPVIDP